MAAELNLDGTKIHWYQDRVDAWRRGERIAPVTVDMSLLPRSKCNFNCVYCYANLQEQRDSQVIDKTTITHFLDDAAEMGVKGISLVSDGESSHSPIFEHTITHGSKRGLTMAVGTNALVVGPELAASILPHLTYYRVNISAGETKRYAEIMGVKDHWFERVCDNISSAVRIKRENKLDVTIGMQMVLMPEFADQIIPLTELAIKLEPDYLVIKHCSDDEYGNLGVNYDGYEDLTALLKTAEAMSNQKTKIAIKWSKIEAKGLRSYQRCYGPPFHIQLSGTGLVAPCGMLFNERYEEKFHIGNIVNQRFKEIVQSERYWDVMNMLASPEFNAQTMCGSLCLQHKTNEVLDSLMKSGGSIEKPDGPPPAHIEFL